MSGKERSLVITDSEWEVMRVIWANEKVTSKEITAILATKKNWKSTTVKTLVSRLVDKEMVGTEKIGNKFLYFPLIEEENRLEGLSIELLDKICSKKIGAFIELLVQNSNISYSDIEKLETLLASKKTNAPEQVACNCVPGQCECRLIS